MNTQVPRSSISSEKIKTEGIGVRHSEKKQGVTMSFRIMMIQLSHSHFVKDDSFIPLAKHEYMPEAYPLGLGYLSNALNDKGYKVEFVDLWAHPEEFYSFFLRVDNYDAIGISFYITQYSQLKYIVERIKNSNKKIPIIVGGPGAKPSYKILLDNLPIDFIVFEEAEISLINLTNEIFSDKNYRSVRGIAFRNEDNSCIVNEPQPPIKELDDLDFPDRKCLDYHIYHKYSPMPGMEGMLSTNVISGRGCPYKCTYCSKTFSGCRFRSIPNVISEIKHLKENFGIQSIIFNDELVVASQKRVYELCEGIKSLNVKWGCQGRVNTVDAPLLRKMKDSGCEYIGYGFESATQRILDNMKKKINVSEMVKVYKMTKDMGIIPVIQYMYGFIGENEESLQDTIRFFKEIDFPALGFYVQAIPGTELYEYCLERGLITDEKEYLENFAFGYNQNRCTINFSEFPSIEILNKKIQATRRRINMNYYKRHPIKFLEKCKEKVRGKFVSKNSNSLLH